MKSLDQRLSVPVSPFDDNDIDQTDVTREQYLAYRKDALINALGVKNGYQEYDLYLENVLDYRKLHWFLITDHLSRSFDVRSSKHHNHTSPCKESQRHLES